MTSPRLGSDSLRMRCVLVRKALRRFAKWRRRPLLLARSVLEATTTTMTSFCQNKTNERSPAKSPQNTESNTECNRIHVRVSLQAGRNVPCVHRDETTVSYNAADADATASSRYHHGVLELGRVAGLSGAGPVEALDNRVSSPGALRLESSEKA